MRSSLPYESNDQVQAKGLHARSKSVSQSHKEGIAGQGGLAGLRAAQNKSKDYLDLGDLAVRDLGLQQYLEKSMKEYREFSQGIGDQAGSAYNPYTDDSQRNHLVRQYLAEMEAYNEVKPEGQS